MPSMKFTIEGEEYVFDWKMSVRDAMFIQEKAHVAPRDLWGALDRQDPSAVAAFVYVVRRGHKEAVKWEDMLDMDLLSFRVLPSDEVEEKEEDEGKSADPTSPPGKTRKRGSTGTSGPSLSS